MSEFEKKINEIGELYAILNDYKETINDRIKEKHFLEQIELFQKEYSNLINIKRFCIPIIGKCNSGKSTFLNYLLKQKVLEINEDISTKFICIIRHDAECKIPRIFKVNIKERGEINGKKLYNFEEGEEIDTKGCIAKIIKDKNEEERNIDSNDPKDYFLMMKINIPFFNEGKFAPYSNYFELMDIPGLNDDGEEYYIGKLFPYFINNSKFCFFVFDAEEYQNEDTKTVFNEFLEKFENKENIYKNSIFILNKIDRVEKGSEPQNFEEYMENNLQIKNIDCICCNSKLLHLNHFKLESFLNYLEYIFSKPKDEKIQDTNEYIVQNLKDHFDINLNQYTNEEYNVNEEQEKEFKEYSNNTIISEIEYNKLTNLNNYIYYKNFFDENKKKKEIKDDEEITKIQSKIKNTIFNSCKATFNSYLDLKKFNELKDEITKKCHIITKKKINEKNPFKNDITIKIIFDNFKEIIEKIKSIKGEHEYIKSIINEFKCIENFFKNESKIRIPTLGCYSSGKSSLLNNLIGYDVLPVGKNVVTKIGIIIDYTDSINNICLKKTILKQSKYFLEDYYCFEDEKDVIYSKLENMKEILTIINISYSYNYEFADLIINFIKRFEEIEIKESLKEISNLIENILKNKKKEDFKKLNSILSNLNDENKQKISFIKINDTLEKIIKKEIKINYNEDKKENMINNNEDKKELFLKLIIPIKILDEIESDDNIKKKIELIDIPGLDTEQKYLDKTQFGTLIKYSNGFLFVTKKNSTKTKSNKNIMLKVINKIRMRKLLDFSFNSLFFILTNCESSLNENMEAKKKDIKNAINSEDTIINKNIKDESEFLISEFSNTEYNKYLEDYNILEDINKFYDYLKQTKNDIKQFLDKLNNKNDYEKNKPSDDDINKYKSEFNLNIEDNFISQYLFLKENLSKHPALKKSNYIEFKENFSKLIESSKKSLDESLKKGIINLNEKLEKLKITINEKIKKLKEDFEKKIKVLETKISNGIREEEIVDFSSKWKDKKDNLDKEIKEEIVKVYSEIDQIKTLKNSEYEKRYFFTKKHIIAHAGAAGAQAIGEGAILIFSSISIAFPPIAIAVGAFALIHGGICIGKFIRDKKNEKKDLKEHLSNYKNTFIENLVSYESDINTFLDLRKNNEIRDIKDKNIVGSLDLTDEENKKFEKIYSLFENKKNSYFNLE